MTADEFLGHSHVVRVADTGIVEQLEIGARAGQRAPARAGEQAAELETLFTQFESPLVESWEPSALLTELLLLEGFPLDSRVRPLPAFTANTLLEVSSDFCAHRLTVCLDARLHPATLAALELRAEDTFICLESALDDEAKLRLADRCNLKVV